MRKATMTKIVCKVRIQDELPEPFEIIKRVRQEDDLP